MRMYQVHMPALLIWIKSYVRYRIRPRREEWRLAMFARPPLPPERKLAQLGRAGRGTEFPHRAPLPQSGRRLPEFPTAGLENGGRQVGVESRISRTAGLGMRTLKDHGEADGEVL